MTIDCGGALFMGDNEACAEGGWDGIVHFVRATTDAGSCSRGRRGDVLTLDWREHEPIGAIATQVVAYARSTPGRLLVHCQSGHHRAPHGALLAALGRGIDPLDVLRLLTRERWRRLGWCPAWQDEHLNAIMALRDQAGFR